MERPAFRKLLVGCDFSQHLLIPPAFIKYFNGRSLGKCTLRGPSGDCWPVELEKREDGLFFHKGWHAFAEDHFLHKGDFLIFDYDGGSKFDVTTYDQTCCEKDVEAAKRESSNPCDSGSGDDVVRRKRPAGDHLEETSTGSISFKSKHTCFTRTLMHYNRATMLIPKDVAIAEGLMNADGLRSKETLMLQDPTGRSWRVHLHVTCDGRLVMQRGWPKCRTANRISLGDSIVFEFVKQSVVQVHIYRGNSCSMVLSCNV